MIRFSAIAEEGGGEGKMQSGGRINPMEEGGKPCDSAINKIGVPKGVGKRKKVGSKDHRKVRLRSP